MPTRKIGRDATTGKFISIKDAKKDKRGAVVETITIQTSRKKKIKKKKE